MKANPIMISRAPLASILMVAAVFLTTQTALPHPPSRPDVTFDKETGKLEVSVNHGVRNVEKHYIKKIVVTVGDKEVINQEFSKQSDKKKHEASFDLKDVKDGDVIKVKATCNVFGSKTTKITVEDSE